MLIYGKQPVYHAIEHHSSKITTLYLAKELESSEYSRLMRYDFDVKRIPQNAAQQMSKSGNHQGFLAQMEEVEQMQLKDLLQMESIVVLCGITDVGNLGAIIRSAYALGVEGVIITGIKRVKFDAVVRSSVGTLLDTSFCVVQNLYDVITELKNRDFKLYGADMSGEDIEQVQTGCKTALFLGSEESGIAPRALKRLDRVVKIEMAHEFDSLNVSVAGAILMHRMRR